VLNRFRERYSLRPFGNCSMRCPNSCIHAVVRLCVENAVYVKTRVRSSVARPPCRAVNVLR
jgi:hypothetical protein